MIKLLALLLFLSGSAFGQGVNDNPVPGSVWTYYGPSFGAAFSPSPAALLFVITPEQYGAVGNNVADDTSSVLNSCNAAQSAGKILILQQAYRVTSNQTYTCDWMFIGGANLNLSTGLTVTHVGKTTAGLSDFIYKGLSAIRESNAPVVSVAWWGASATNTDSGPAFQAAGGSNRTIYIPTATYTFCSFPSQPYAALNFNAVWWKQFSNFVVLGNQSILTVCGSRVTTYGMILLDQDSNYTIKELQINGVQGQFSSPTTTENSGISIMNAQNAAFTDMLFPGNWGGIGAPFVGDYMLNVSFSRIQMPKTGLCFDFAFLQNVVFDHIVAVGSDASAGQGLKCLSVINDTPNNSNGTLGITDTNGVVFQDSTVSNFSAAGAQIVSGQNFFFSHNVWTGNLGNGAGLHASAIDIFYNNGGSFTSVNHAPGKVTIDGDSFLSNGNVTYQTPAVNFDSGECCGGSDTGMSGFIVANSRFFNNYNAGVEIQQPITSGDINIRNTNVYSGPNQSAPLGPGALALGSRVGVATSQGGGSGASIAAGSTIYMAAQGSGTNESFNESIIGVPGTWRNFSLTATVAPGVGQTFVGTVRYQGSASPLTCTISGTNTSCQDTTHTQTAAVASLYDVQVVTSGGAAATTLYWGLEFDIPQ